MKLEIYTAYAPDNDMTFIMQELYNGDTLKATYCIGWYFGEPDEQKTKTFSGQLKAEYNL